MCLGTGEGLVAARVLLASRSGRVVRDGQGLEGDLAIKGYGDPYLVTEEFWKNQTVIL